VIVNICAGIFGNLTARKEILHTQWSVQIYFTELLLSDTNFDMVSFQQTL